jgi:thioredoxin-like negative regulator of GroEL
MFGPLFENVMLFTNTSYTKIDASVNHNLVSSYNVSSVPTLIFEKNGQEVKRHTGVMSEAQLTSLLGSL